MKIASSSASFARAIADGELTQLEWLDLCANELEVDGVSFDAAQFPRRDTEYLAQLKKTATDLGLTVAAVAADDTFAAGGEEWVAVAVALGAPLLIARLPAAGNDAALGGALTQTVKERTGQAKRANVTLAARNARGTLCASENDLRRLLKDVDSAWLRCALDANELGSTDSTEHLLGKAVIALHAIDDVVTFATHGDAHARALVEKLARFRGFIVLERGADGGPPDALHAALARFVALRCAALQN